MAWNNFRSSRIYSGQKIVVFPGYNNSNTTVSKSSGNYHTVRRGETLGLIARKYGVNTTDLKKWNNLRGNLIRINQDIRVKPPETTSQSTSSTEGKYHTVQPGDTLWEIANQYDGVTIEQIKRLNNLSNTDWLNIGQKIRLSKDKS